MKDPQLSGIAKALAAQGRNGDTELIHVSRKELETLKKYGDELGIHLTVNPQTGLPEAFNWGGMAGSVGLPLLVLAATAATGGVAAPWMLAAAGAAGGAGGTLLGGGSTDQALMSGVMGGIGGWGMGSLAGNIAAEGVTAAATEGATQMTQEAAANTIAEGLKQSATTQFADLGGDVAANAVAPTVTDAVANTAAQTTAPAATGGFAPFGGDAPIAAGKTIVGAPAELSLAQAPQTQLQQIGAGLNAITSSPSALGNFAMNNAKNIGMTGIGALGAGMTMNPQEQTITTEPDTSNPYKGEMYMDPATGQWRSRAVRRAEGGEVFSDYDAADAQKDGGYAPGGYLNLAAGGGIGDLGGYSDGGRLLRGPGDGVSDNIPASIEGKRPARLADGEFVIPARAVSELGNGSTEAGSKQLYAMLDRIAAKRKSGKGLAYQANPKKMLPA